MKKNIKSEIKSLYLKLRREYIKREKYYESKSEEWQSSITGEKYQRMTDHLWTLMSDMDQSVDELNIKIPYLK